MSLPKSTAAAVPDVPVTPVNQSEPPRFKRSTGNRRYSTSAHTSPVSPKEEESKRIKGDSAVKLEVGEFSDSSDVELVIDAPERAEVSGSPQAAAAAIELAEEPLSAYVMSVAYKAQHYNGGFDSQYAQLAKAQAFYSQFHPSKPNPVRLKMEDIIYGLHRMPGATSSYGAAEVRDFEHRSAQLYCEAIQVEQSLDVDRIGNRFVEVRFKKPDVPMLHRVYRALFHGNNE